MEVRINLFEIQMSSLTAAMSRKDGARRKLHMRVPCYSTASPFIFRPFRIDASAFIFRGAITAPRASRREDCGYLEYHMTSSRSIIRKEIGILVGDPQPLHRLPCNSCLLGHFRC